MVKKIKPYKTYRSVLESLSKVVNVKLLSDKDAIEPGGRKKNAKLDSRFKVAVWNIYKGHGGLAFENEFRRLLKKTDLVLTQEALLHPTITHLFNHKGFSWVHCASYRRRDGLADGVMTLCRGLAFSSLRITSLAKEPIFKTPKVSLVTFYKLDNGESLMVVNLHKILVRTIKQSEKELKNILNALPEHSGPAIVAGDFNTFTSNYQKEVTRLLKNYGYKYVASKGRKPTLLNSLDHVYTRGLDIHTAVVDTTFTSSDHFPIIVEMSVL